MRREEAVPLALLALLFVGIAAWTWSWPDHPLIPDEAIAKSMADFVATNGTPFHEEPFKDYASGTFGTDRYGNAYANHTVVRPPTSIAAAYEQGLLGAKMGRAISLAIGTASVAFLAWRILGPWAGFFGGALYLAHPATLYFHQSYFANSGGAAWFLAALALLEASRRWWWLAPASVAAASVAVVFRVEYALGMLVVVPLAFLVLRGWRALVAYGASLALVMVFLWNLESWTPLTYTMVFTEPIPLAQLMSDPLGSLALILERYRRSSSLDDAGEWDVYAAHVNDYFVWFFPLVAVLALVGLFARAPRGGATWVYAPLGAQTLAQAYAILPALGGFDFSEVSWLESSVVRYFLPTYAFLALLAGVALAAALPRVLSWRHAAYAAPVAVAVLVVSASVATAVTAEHGVAWANERRAWFDDIEAAAVALDEKAVFVGKTPGKVIFARPVMNPENRAWNARYATDVATDLLGKGHRVFALEPWYWNDHGQSIERLLQARGKTYWTDTGVAVDCPCGEFARFYELHRTNASLVNVSRLDAGAFEDAPDGLVTADALATFYPERALHVRMGLAQTRGVTVSITFNDTGNASYEAGYWNLPLENAKNRHPGVSWENNGTAKNRTVSFAVPASEVANGALYVRGPPGLLVVRIEVRE